MSCVSFGTHDHRYPAGPTNTKEEAKRIESCTNHDGKHIAPPMARRPNNTCSYGKDIKATTNGRPGLAWDILEGWWAVVLAIPSA